MTEPEFAGVAQSGAADGFGREAPNHGNPRIQFRACAEPGGTETYRGAADAFAAVEAQCARVGVGIRFETEADLRATTGLWIQVWRRIGRPSVGGHENNVGTSLLGDCETIAARAVSTDRRIPGICNRRAERSTAVAAHKHDQQQAEASQAQAKANGPPSSQICALMLVRDQHGASQPNAKAATNRRICPRY